MEENNQNNESSQNIEKNIEENISKNSRRSVEKNKLNKKKIYILVIIAVLVMAIIGYLVSKSLMTEDDVEKATTIIEETNISFLYDTKGLVKNDDEIVYIMQEGISISNILPTEKVIGDSVVTGDILINYTETLEEGTETTTKLPQKDGYVMDINDVDNEVLLRTGMTFSVQVTGYTPSVGDCGIIVLTDSVTGTEYIFNGKITDKFTISGRGTNVTFDVINNNKILPENYTTETYFENSERSAMYDCEQFELSGGKIVIQNVGASDPQHVESNDGVFEEITKLYDDTFNTPGADYEFVDQTRGSYSVGDYITTSDTLFTYNWKKMTSTDKTILSEFDGTIKDVLIEESKVEITVYDNLKNYLTFDITEEYEDKISKNMEVVVKKGDTATTTSIFDVQDNIASINHSRFSENKLDDEYDIHIEGSDEVVLLIPIEYVKDGKVKKEIDGKFEEIEITYEEYTNEKYKVLTGLSSGDKVEEY